MRRRLVLSAAAVTSMVVLAFLVPLALIVRDIVAERAVARARIEAESLAPAVAAGDAAELRDRVAEASTRLGYAVSVVLPGGATVGAVVPQDGALDRARRGGSFTDDVAGGIAVYAPVVGPDAIAVVRVVVPDAALRDGVHLTWAALAALGVLLTGVAVVVSDRLAVGVVRPVAALADTARRLERGELDARVDLAGPPEVAAVGNAINRLAVRVRELLDAERESAADLAHRLRTPMTALRLDAEGLADRDESARLTDDVDRLARAVDQVISDARRPSRVGVAAVADLRAVVEERVEFWAALAEDQGRPIGLTVDVHEAPVALPAADLTAAVDALLGNVFAHTPDDAGVQVLVRRAGSGLVEMVVDDDGPGLPADALERGVSGAGSSGLGMDIARRTAMAGGGGITVGRSPSGGGRVVLGFALAGGQSSSPP